MRAMTPALTTEDRLKLQRAGLIASQPVSADVVALESEWKAALGRARTAFAVLAEIEQRYCAAYRRSAGRRMPNRDAYAIPECGGAR